MSKDFPSDVTGRLFHCPERAVSPHGAERKVTKIHHLTKTNTSRPLEKLDVCKDCAGVSKRCMEAVCCHFSSLRHGITVEVTLRVEDGFFLSLTLQLHPPTCLMAK